MDKYLLIVLMFLIAGMIIAVTKEIPEWGLFYSMLAGALIVIFYSSWKGRKEQKELRKKRRKFKK
ncbi:MAG TPA: hypothetical protein VLC72_05165 [Nitrosopumilaceae archaeon]|nr:hypothetical protein [Nitrosopumilaceae archaeon]